jgi:hypothetical protein
MVLQDGVLVVYYKNKDHIIRMGNLTREEIRVKVCKILPANKCDLSFFRANEHFFSDDYEMYSDIDHFKNSVVA